MADRIQNCNKVPRTSPPTLPAQKASVDPVPENLPPSGSISSVSTNYVLGMSLINNGALLPTKIFDGLNTDETIDNIAKKTQSLKVEVLNIIDSTGKLVYSHIGGKDKIILPSNIMDKGSNGIIIHNHPLHSSELGSTSFSPEDIITAINANAKELIVFSNGNKYSIKLPDSYNKDELIEKVTDKDNQWDYKDNFFWHKSWTDLAEQGYFTYSAEKIDPTVVHDEFLARKEDEIIKSIQRLTNPIDRNIRESFKNLGK